ncbi:MAG: alpha/beta hydrolase [Pseudomonadota bacterium]
MLIETDDQEAPPGATVEMLERPGKVALRYAIWPARGEENLGTVCLFGGRTEFIEKYYEVIAELQDRGFAVATMDWRGQGLSSRHTGNRLKGHIRSYQHYVDDLDAFMREIVMPECPPPYYALAHSMGGHILLRYGRTGANPFDRMVLLSPMIAIHPALGPGGVSSGLVHMLTLCGLGRMPVGRLRPKEQFDGNLLTSDAPRYAAFTTLQEVEPDLRITAPTFSWLRATLRSIGAMARSSFAKGVTVPALIIIGSLDKVVSVDAAEDMGTRLRAGRTLVIPGARHELLMEKDAIRDLVWAAFDAFIPARDGTETRTIERLSL